jgi:hypothetical protein
VQPDAEQLVSHSSSSSSSSRKGELGVKHATAMHVLLACVRVLGLARVRLVNYSCSCHSRAHWPWVR